jgi:iron complex transport system substrate-binding protein
VADDDGTIVLSKEEIVEANPDILILAGRVSESPEKAQQYYDEFVVDPDFAGLDALKNGRVHMAQENHTASMSHYIVLAVQDLTAIAYPNLFQ